MLPDEGACVRLLIQLRWSEGVRCPHCGSGEIVQLTSRYRRHYHRYVCKSCTRRLGRKRTFTDLTGTLFEGTKVPLAKWFQAGRLFIMARSTASIAKEVEVGYLTARRMVRLLAASPYLAAFAEAGNRGER
ncbi:MAG: transposase [Candidatus Methylomirabilales bacterium]